MVTVGILAELCKSNFLAIIGGFACFVFYRLIERVVFVFWDVLLDP